MTYEVKVSRVILYWDTFDIDAKNEAEAIKKARDKGLAPELINAIAAEAYTTDTSYQVEPL